VDGIDLNPGGDEGERAEFTAILGGILRHVVERSDYDPGMRWLQRKGTVPTGEELGKMSQEVRERNITAARRSVKGKYPQSLRTVGRLPSEMRPLLVEAINNARARAEAQAKAKKPHIWRQQNDKFNIKGTDATLKLLLQHVDKGCYTNWDGAGGVASAKDLYIDMGVTHGEFSPV